MSEGTEYRFVFGPVPSRRLGRSLGVDVVPHKTCTFDCTYCQVGRTTEHTAERQAFVPLDEVLDEIRRKIDSGADPDYITISGSGEPTLYSELGALIDGTKAFTSVPVAVITNGSLLWREDVRRDLMRASLVVPSLDAGTDATYRAVNRPHSDVSFDRLISGLAEFRRVFPGQLWLEVFLLDGVCDLDAEVDALAAHVQTIRPDRVQLNTVARPPADPDARAVPIEQLERYAERFVPKAEVIAEFKPDAAVSQADVQEKDVLDLLRRRPCSVMDVSHGLRIHPHEAAKHIGHLLLDNAVRRERRGETDYYLPVADATDG